MWFHLTTDTTPSASAPKPTTWLSNWILEFKKPLRDARDIPTSSGSCEDFCESAPSNRSCDSECTICRVCAKHRGKGQKVVIIVLTPVWFINQRSSTGRQCSKYVVCINAAFVNYKKIPITICLFVGTSMHFGWLRTWGDFPKVDNRSGYILLT